MSSFASIVCLLIQAKRDKEIADREAKKKAEREKAAKVFARVKKVCKHHTCAFRSLSVPDIFALPLELSQAQTDL